MPRLRKLQPPITILSTVLLLALWSGCDEGNNSGYRATGPGPNPDDPFPFSHAPVQIAKYGPDSCLPCHEQAVLDWRKSHHAKANRRVSTAKDRAAFTPTRTVEESGVIYELSEAENKFWLTVVKPDGTREPHELVGVIGETPLRQYLTRFEGNKLQTISASYDVLEDEWFDVYAGENRMPGEWGHWASQGMNWNANCAYCHTTHYEKGFLYGADHYESTWIQQGIACAECHTGLDVHVEASARKDYVTGLTKLTKEQTTENCASCHARRDQLTADAFVPGDHFHDHFDLSLPDQPGLYYADGQILDEDFVYGSFQMSRMAHKGVQCMDCHSPHSMEPILPIDNNMLCMRCHEGGVLEAPIIQPQTHSFHAADSTGNLCVNCHMPKTKYMQVDPRADHGFHLPDPLMTRELGIPNACSGCHEDKGLDWNIDWSEKWYGEKLADSRQRARARAVSAAYQADPEAAGQLLALCEAEDIPAWRAIYAGLLANYLPREDVRLQLEALSRDADPMVRSRAIRGLARVDSQESRLKDSMEDPCRLVRISAARGASIRGMALTQEPAAGEWEGYLAFQSDRPQTLFLLAQQAARAGQADSVEDYVTRAIAMDTANPEMYHQAAILLSSAGLNEQASQTLYKGWDLAPENPIFPYSLGLLAAEANDYEKAISFLQETVSVEPEFYRAWYNLSLAYQKLGRVEEAQKAMQRARGQ
ncbi:tetratricopeptide repeat protein [Coraliomargarita parva]|uniref:tetratricopeptide repeat protein n=1 Tax=Coraliomargarita parva TaxID=3014050 RepID=UPI0022B43058|nr:tetratricopeptide repeat protein [Coraliomargarita parva]